MRQQVQTKRDAVANRKINVCRSATGAIGAEIECAGKRATNAGSFIDQIDRTAGRAAPGVSGAWSFHDVDLLEVERIARLRTEIAHAVDEDVVTRAETPQRQVVARGITAFAGRDRQTGNVAQHVAQRRRYLFLDNLFRDHSDGLRGV